MKAKNKKLLLMTAALGASASLLAPSETVEAFSSTVQNVTPVNAGHYQSTTGERIPLVLYLHPEHPDYAALKKQGLHKNGNVYLYLQNYKDKIYYYSPVVRTLKNGEVRNVSLDIKKRLDGTEYEPSYNKGFYQLPGNNRYERGKSYREGFTSVTNSVSGLHHKLSNGKDDYNFRKFMAIPPVEAGTWSPEYLRTPKHRDTTQRHINKNTWKRGEYRQLGYHESGNNFHNPYFPMDGMRPNGSSGMESYPLNAFPWSYSRNRSSKGGMNSEIDERVYQYAIHKNMYGIGKNKHHTRWKNNSINWNNPKEAELYKTAYEEKKQSMTRLYEGSSKIRNNVTLKGLSKSQAIRALTVKYTALNTNPFGDDTNLNVTFEKDGPSLAGHYFQISLTLPGKQISSQMQNTEIKEQRVYNRDTGKLLQTFKRYKVGNNSYKTSRKNYVALGNQYPKIASGDRLRVETDVFIDDAFRSTTQYRGELELYTSFNKNKIKYTLKGNSKIKKSGSTFKRDVNVSENKAGVYDINTVLDKRHYNETRDMRWDSKANTALNKLEVSPNPGKVKAEDVKLVDKSGKVAKDPIPGHEYKIRYQYNYSGKIPSNVNRTATVSLNQDIGREMRTEQLFGSENQGVKKLTPVNTSASGKLYDGKTFVFETPYQVYETGQLDTEAVFNIDISDTVTNTKYEHHEDIVNGKLKKWTTSSTYKTYYKHHLDSKSSEEWKSKYDLSVSNVNVIPSDVENSHSQDSPALVKFDIDYQTPAFVSNLGHDVDVLVKVGNQVIQSTQHVRKGKNQSISVPVDTHYPGNKNTVLDAEVIVNTNKLVYETDDNVSNMKDRNNYATGKGRINKSKVVPFNDSNNYVSWKQYFQENNWTGDNINYRSFSGSNINFNRFTSKDNQRNAYRNFYEEYKIDAVRFRSRLTRQEEMGRNGDGWVNLLEEDGIIKAGYGYELEVDVSYQSNADIRNHDNTGTVGNWSRPQLTEPLLQDNIYVKLPNDVIRSVQGDGGTENKLRIKEVQGNKMNKRWTFEIDGGESLGVHTTGRFYIGEKVKDGRYPIDVFTPKIRGVNGKMTSPHIVLEHLLYDSENDLGIRVVGADVDDISDHINQ